MCSGKRGALYSPWSPGRSSPVHHQSWWVCMRAWQALHSPCKPSQSDLIDGCQACGLYILINLLWFASKHTLLPFSYIAQSWSDLYLQGLCRFNCTYIYYYISSQDDCLFIISNMIALLLPSWDTYIEAHANPTQGELDCSFGWRAVQIILSCLSSCKSPEV